METNTQLAGWSASRLPYGPVNAPLSLLSGLIWSVLDPPEKAFTAELNMDLSRIPPISSPTPPPRRELDLRSKRDALKTNGISGGISGNHDKSYNDKSNDDDYEDEEVEEIPKTPASIQSRDRDLMRNSLSMGGACDLDTIVFRGPTITLMLPRDSMGVLGLDSVAISPDPPSIFINPTRTELCVRGIAPGITQGQILGAIHSYYQQDLDPKEVIQIMATHRRLRRQVQVAWQRCAPVTKGCLLGPGVSFQGLQRCSVESRVPVYVLQLSS